MSHLRDSDIIQLIGSRMPLAQKRAGKSVEKANFVYYQEDDLWIGWLEEYPDYHTQGKTLDELKQNLKDIYDDLSAGKIPNARRRGELVVG